MPSKDRFAGEAACASREDLIGGGIPMAPPLRVILWRPRTPPDWLDWLCGRGRYPRRDRAQIVVDAERLLTVYGDAAYGVARDFAEADPPILDPARSPWHWCHVKMAIADHLGLVVGDPGHRRDDP